MYLSKLAHNSFALFIFKSKCTKSFLSILEISSKDFAKASNDLIFYATKSVVQILHVTMFSML